MHCLVAPKYATATAIKAVILSILQASHQLKLGMASA